MSDSKKNSTPPTVPTQAQVQAKNPQPKPQPKKEVQLQIEALISKRKNGRKRQQKIIIQDSTTYVYLKITNISTLPLKGAVLKQFKMRETGSGILSADSASDFEIPTLNPKDSFTLSLGNFTLPFHGAAWVSAIIVPQDDNQTIKTYQYDRRTKEIEPYSKSNAWGDTLIVHGKMQILQQKTNFYILLLTLVTFLEAVFGLKEIFINIEKLLSKLFLALGAFCGGC